MLKTRRLKMARRIIGMVSILYCLGIGSVFSQVSKSLPLGWTDLDAKAIGHFPVLQISGTPNSLEVTFELKGFNVTHKDCERRLSKQITFPGQSYLNIAGAPELPVFRRLMVLPNREAPTIHTEVLEEQIYGPVLLPITSPATLEQSVSSDDGSMPPLDIQGDVFPAASLTLKPVGISHGVPLALLTIHPIRYNPGKSQLRMATRIQIEIQFDSGHAENRTYTVPPQLKPIFDEIIVDADQNSNPWLKTSKATKGINYLIVTDPQFENSPSLLSLINYHRFLGRNVSVITTSETGNTADAIKETIQAVYHSQSPPSLEYLLLIGDLDIIPYKTNAYVYQSSGRTRHRDSDIWYAWLDGDDFLADVAMGRFPARSEDELHQMVFKTLRHQWGVDTGEWRDKALLVAHKDEYPGRFTDCKEMVYVYNYNLGAPIMDRLYGGDPGQDPTNTALISAFHEGRYVVNYRGHGSSSAWSGWNRLNESFSIENVRFLRNGTMTPVVFSICCNTGDMRPDTESLGEAFMRHNEGAVAFLGANDLSYTTYNSPMDRRLFTGIWDAGVTQIGHLLNYATVRVLLAYGEDSFKNATVFSWMGDPALNLSPPEPPPVYGCQVGVNGGGFVSVLPDGLNQYAGTVLTARAIPHAGWEFDGWEESTHGSENPMVHEIDGDVSVMARFLPEPHIEIEAEPNDESESADGPLSSGIPVSGTVSSSLDADWYYIDLNQPGLITVLLKADQNSDLDWTLYHENDLSNSVMRGYTINPSESGVYEANEPGRYFVSVRGYHDNTGSYTLIVRGGLSDLSDAPEIEEAESERLVVPQSFKVDPVYPNPFNAHGTVRYQVPVESNVDIVFFNNRAQVVRRLVQQRPHKPGTYHIIWNGRDDQGHSLPSGTYLVQVMAGEHRAVKKCTLLK